MKKLKPQLRFPEFTGDWEKKKLGEVADISSGGTPSRTNPNYWGGDIPWVSTSLIDFNFIDRAEEFITAEGLRNSSAKLFPIGTLLMAMYGQGKTRGKTAILAIEASTNQACGAILVNQEKINPLFTFQNLSKRYDEIRDLSNQGGQENLSGGIIKGIEIAFPTLPEQHKIAAFLSAVDDKLTKLKKKKDRLEQYKKGVMQKLFSQEIRFRDENGNSFPDWEVKKLGEVLFEHLEKNKNNNTQEVFSVAKHKGVINQIEHLGRSFSANEITHYKLIFPFDIVYTKSPTSDFPFGIIKQNMTGRTGVVSPLYGVFKPITPSLGFILHNYFNFSINVYNYLSPLVQKGAKNTMNINNSDFLNGAGLSLPVDEKEQILISNFLGAIDDKIALCGREIDKMEVWKKGLLQKMFV
ncbi:MAG: restriction endonuclease subunit S [Leadbetterella sp.]|nr:restriction endonuclease subunit S [Leadbetterella sp.]